MLQKIRYTWEELNSSFWFIPLLIILFVIGLAFGLITLDRLQLFENTGALRYIFSGSSDSARSILSIVAGAMIGAAGTVFSITLVVLTLASSQFGSRMLRNFMHDQINQVVLGTYVATFIYCLIVLNAVSDTPDFRFIPIISVFGALLIAIVNMILLVVFINHISISIQSDHIISNISRSLSLNAKTLFPIELGEEFKRAEPNTEDLKYKFSKYSELKSHKSGYLQSVDSERLLRLAIDNNLIVFLFYRPGDYLVENLKIAEVYSDRDVEEELSEKLTDIFMIGYIRTPIQDAEFAIHQMVEIASRALSPGINDPNTAISCIDNLSSVLSYLTNAKFPSPYRYDPDGNLRVVATKSLTFEGMLDAAYNQIRQFSRGNLSVLIRLMDALIMIHGQSKNESCKEVVLKHGAMVYNLANETVQEERDLAYIKERYEILTSK